MVKRIRDIRLLFRRATDGDDTSRLKGIEESFQVRPRRWGIKKHRSTMPADSQGVGKEQKIFV